MNYLRKFTFILMMFLCYGIHAQPSFDLVCLELNVGGETSIIAVTSNIVEETQASLAEQGIESAIVDCEDDFDLPPDLGDLDHFGDFGDINWPPTDIDFGDIVCLELTVDGETSTIALTANAVEETQAGLLEQGIESTVVECEDDFDYSGGFDWGDFGGGDVDFGDIVCLELTVDGETSTIAVTANAVEETQAGLLEQGIASTVIECEDDFDYSGGFDWGDFGGGDVDWGDAICLEIIEAGDTSIIAICAAVLEETQTALAEQGIESTVVECEDDFDYSDGFDWGDFGGGDVDWGEIVCLELTADEDTSIVALPAALLEETQAALIEQGIESTVVECEDDFDYSGGFDDIDWDDFNNGDVDFGDVVCLELTVEGETSTIAVTANVLEETQAALAEEGIESTVVECDNDYTFPIDFGDFDWDPTNIDIDFGDIVCLEITVEGETSIIAVTANVLEEAQASLTEQGIESTVVECEGNFDFPPHLGDWGHFGDYGDINWDPIDIDFGDIVCLEITTEGETSIIGITANALEETQAVLAEQGIESTVVECEDDFDITGGFDWGDFGGGDIDIDYDELVCLEITADGETSVIAITANILEETQAVLAEQGFESTVVECEDDPAGIYGNTNLNTIDNTEFTKFSIFPNPANVQDLVNVKFDSNTEEVVTLRVMNQLGQISTNRQLSTYKGSNTIELNTSKLDAGLYIISLSNGKDFNFTDKLLIVK